MRRISSLASVRRRAIGFVVGLLLCNVLCWVIYHPVQHSPRMDVLRVDRFEPDAKVRMLTAEQASYDWHSKQVGLNVTFNYAIRPADAASRLKLCDEDNHPIATTVAPLDADAAAKSSKTIRLTTAPLPEIEAGSRSRLRLDFLRGSVSAADPQSSSATDNAIWLDVAPDLMLTGVEPTTTHDRKPALSLHFNHELDAGVLQNLVTVDPPVPFKIDGHRDTSTVTLSGVFKPATRYAVRIAQRSDDQDPQRYPRGGVCSTFVPDLKPEVWLDHAMGYLSSAGRRRITAHAINVTEVSVEISKVYDNNIVVWRNASSSSIDQQARVIATRTIAVSSKKNEQQDCDISLDDLLPAEMRGDGVFQVRVRGAAVAGLVGRSLPNDEEEEYDQVGAGRSHEGSALITLSDIALTAKRASDRLTVWATSLATGRPLAHIRLRAYTAENQLAGETTTDDSGLAQLASTSFDGHAVQILLADAPPTGRATTVPSEPNSLTWLDLRESELSTADNEQTHGASYRANGYDAFVYANRGIYRPGETVQLRAVVRDGHGATPGPFPVEWVLRGPDNRLREGTVTLLDNDGSAAWSLTLPAEVPTGPWNVGVCLPGAKHKGGKGGEAEAQALFGELQFRVEEFIPDRIKVRASFGSTSVPGARFNSGSPLVANVQADYLFGQPAAGLACDMMCRLDPAPFTLPGWAGWTFNDNGQAASTEADVRAAAVEKRFENLALDEHGHAQQQLSCETLLAKSPLAHSVDYQGPWSVSMTAEVRESGGRAVVGRSSVTVDRVSRYVGIRPHEGNPREGVPQEFDVVLLHPDGTVNGSDANLDLSLLRQTWNNSWTVENGRYSCRSTRRLEPVQKNAHSNIHVTGGRGSFRATPPAAGEYVVSVRDPDTARTVSYSLLVSGDQWSDSVSREHPESLEVRILPPPPVTVAQIPDLLDPLRLDPILNTGAPLLSDRLRSAIEARSPEHRDYLAGEEAIVVVRSPFAGTLLLTVETDHIISTRVVEMTASSVTVPVRIEESCSPNAFVCASVVRAIDTRLPWRVHRAYGMASVKTDESARRLAIEVHAPERIDPEQSLPVAVRITDNVGRPVANAALTVAVADEGICQLTDYRTPDPFHYFTRWHQLGVSTHDTYLTLMPDSDRSDKSGDIGGDGDGDVESRHASPVSARRIRSLAMISPLLHSDADGYAKADFPLPPFVGKARLMVVSFGNNHFGAAEQFVTIRSNLVVQSTWPRFVAPGDSFDVPLTVFNNTSAAGDAIVRVQTEADGPLGFDISDGHGRSSLELLPIAIRAGQQAPTHFRVIAGARAGIGRVETTVTLGGETFHETLELPVRPASPMVTSAGADVVTTQKPCVFSVPSGMLKGIGKLVVRVNSKPALNLPEGLDYLDRYPYGCAEQTVSTAFPLVYLSDLGEVIGPEVFQRDHVNDKVQAAIARLVMMQNASGALPMWSGGEDWPWASVYAAHFVLMAEGAGHHVPHEFRDRLLDYVRSRLIHSSDQPDTLETQAYACYVLALSGRADRNAMNRLTATVLRPRPAEAPQPTPQTSFHLAAAWVAANDKARAAELVPHEIPLPRKQRDLSGNIGSPIRDRAIMLSTLLSVQPDHPALPKLAEELADAGRKGQWRSTQDVAFAVMALGQYARATHDEKPFEHAELWFGDQRLAIAEAGQQLSWQAQDAAGPASTTASTQPAAQRLEIRITGGQNAKGYVSWLQDGIPLTPSREEIREGLEVHRRYLDESGQPLGTRSLRSGQLMRVELTIASLTPVQGLVIEDLLPACLEPENPRLMGSRADADVLPERRVHHKVKGSSLVSSPQTDAAPRDFIASRQDFRDDRVVLFGRLDAGGTYRCTYLARAVTAGSFVVPPVHAECMYDLGTRGMSGGGGTLIVEPNVTAGNPDNAAAVAQ